MRPLLELVSVPEFAVHEDGDLLLHKDDVGLAGNFLIMLPVAVAFRIEFGADELAERDLGLGVLSFYERHDLAASFLGEDVGHGRSFPQS